jgi:NitT/TauT family transport system ATP-binding protein
MRAETVGPVGPSPDNRGSPSAEQRSDTALLRADQLSKEYELEGENRAVLEEISFAVGARDLVSIVGASGCGKTTLLKILGGLVPATSGRAALDGTPITRPVPEKTAVVFQEDALLPWYRIEENVGLGLAARGVSKSERRERINTALSKVSLDGYGRAYPHELSGGMRQRAALARGLVMEPRLLLLDEPFAALDEQTRNLLGEELRTLHQRVGGAMVMVTHSLTEAVLLSDRVIAMSTGPGRIRKTVEIPLPEERSVQMVDTPEFAELRHLLWSELKDDWHRSLQESA